MGDPAGESVMFTSLLAFNRSHLFDELLATSFSTTSTSEETQILHDSDAPPVQSFYVGTEGNHKCQYSKYCHVWGQ
eukprot:JP436669.1.p4 GENE.JP436669.1~~JP436669.1.p4  ORF type:complete len:76 (+),score=11.93 JP436669.1:1-228(+)